MMTYPTGRESETDDEACERMERERVLLQEEQFSRKANKLPFGDEPASDIQSGGRHDIGTN